MFTMLHIYYQESGRGVIQLPQRKAVLWLGKGNGSPVQNSNPHNSSCRGEGGETLSR